jgi:hypothetical protein
MGSELNNPAGKGSSSKGSELNNPAALIKKFKRRLLNPNSIGLRQILRDMGFGSFNKGGAVLKSRIKKTRYF